MAVVSRQSAPWRVEVAVLDQGRVQVTSIELPGDLVGHLTYGQMLVRDDVAALLPAGWRGRPFGLAVYGRRCRLSELVEAGARVEWLPPLQVDPKDARRARVDQRRRELARDRWRTGGQPR